MKNQNGKNEIDTTAYAALRVYVRGFHTREEGDKLVAKLEEMGFDIKEKYAGECDNLGGIIETHITPTINLVVDQIEDIRLSLYADTDIDVFVQWELYACLKQSVV